MRMKKGWIMAFIADGILLAVLFAGMMLFNNRASVGMAALGDMGRFVVCFAAFQAALIALLIMIVIVLVKHGRDQRK